MKRCKNNCALGLLMAFIIICGAVHGLSAQHIPKASIQLSHDNDVFKFKNVTDRDYSFGISAMFQHVLKPATISFLPTRHFGDPENKYIGGVTFFLKGYTPTRPRQTTDLLAIRSFAGTLTLAPYLISANRDRFIKLTLEMGVRGPAAHAGDVQNWFHKLIGDEYVEGWDTQLDHKILVNLYLDYARSFFLLPYLDIIPESSIALGNHLSYVQQGIKIRAGLFNNIDNSASFLTDLGMSSNVEIFTSFLVYGRIQLVDAAWGNGVAIGEELLFIDENNLLGGYEVAFHIEYYRVGIKVGYHKVTPGSNLSVKHSYGNLSLRYKW